MHEYSCNSQILSSQRAVSAAATARARLLGKRKDRRDSARVDARVTRGGRDAC
jgi:hypothetical protein